MRIATAFFAKGKTSHCLQKTAAPQARQREKANRYIRRPEGAKQISPGQRPWYQESQGGREPNSLLFLQIHWASIKKPTPKVVKIFAMRFCFLVTEVIDG